jgi:hypothetical protein
VIRIVGAGHGPAFPGAVNPPDYEAEIVKWFDGHLRTAKSQEAGTLRADG